MNLGLKDKVVLCMASAAGLGKGIAMEAAREGAKVMICTSEAFKDQLYAAQELSLIHIYLCRGAGGGRVLRNLQGQQRHRPRRL